MAKKKAQRGLPGWLKLIIWPFRILGAIVLPFLVLVRVSVFCYATLGWHPWLSLGVGAVLTLLILYYYLTWLYKKITGKKRAKEGARKLNFRIALATVAGFCIYTLLFISASNAKTETIRGEYASVHPLLRLALGSVTLFDRELMVTDMARSQEDYDDMDLKRLKNSLHYPQADGYVHAVDLRTKGRAEWRNSLIRGWFWVMGFGTLRHTGTDDHLHISLMIHENPNAL